MKTQSHEEPRIVAAVERRMQNWVHSPGSRRSCPRRGGAAAFGQVRPDLRRHLREAGTDAGEIARLLGQKLAWEVLDRSLLDRVAERLHEPRTMLDMVDETHSNWAYDVLGAWMDGQIVTHEKYVACLTRVVRAAGRRGKVVFVGRGAQFLLPPKTGLAVRLVASEKYRIAKIVERQSLSETEARRFMLKTDHDRRQFVGRYFHRDVSDPHLYDLVLNVETLGPAATVEQIVAALCR